MAYEPLERRCSGDLTEILKLFFFLEFRWKFEVLHFSGILPFVKIQMIREECRFFEFCGSLEIIVFI